MAVPETPEPGFHWQPATYLELMLGDIPEYERFEDEAADATRGVDVREILELGSGSGETARRVLDRHPGARLQGIDDSEEMLAAARELLRGRDATFAVGRIEDPLPAGPFDLVVSALAVHHLDGRQKRALFARVAAALRPGGRFVLADVVVPDDPAVVRTPQTPGYDRPSSVAEQLRWLAEAGLEARVGWTHRDLAVLVADRPADRGAG